LIWFEDLFYVKGAVNCFTASLFLTLAISSVANWNQGDFSVSYKVLSFKGLKNICFTEALEVY